MMTRGEEDILSVLEIVFGVAAGAGDTGSGVQLNKKARIQAVLDHAQAQNHARPSVQFQPFLPL